MEDNKRDHTDPFKLQDESSKEPETKNDDETTAYYYYGPFKSSANGARPTADEDGERMAVEISRPKPVRPYYAYPDEPKMNERPAIPQWDYSNAKKKSSKFKSYVATFLAGVLVMGGLMFAADRGNWFTEAKALTGGNPVTGGAVNVAGNNGSSGVKNTALANDVVRPGNIAEIVENASPAVVKINTYVTGRRSGSMLFPDDFFNYFFGETPRNQSGQRQLSGMGSGFFFDKTGYILTNEHVVSGADEIEVEVQGYSKPFKAKLLGSEWTLDLAVIKIEGDNFPTLPLGDSDNIKVGDWVVAIGNPYGFDHTVTVGVLSAKERDIPVPDRNGNRNYKNLLQTDASINPGNSGGPLLDLSGQVIGINTAVSADAQGIGFAIPSSTVLSVLENLKNNVKIPLPYIGVNIMNIPEEWVNDLKLKSTDGVLVRSVVKGSPAEKADLQPYDVITELNGEKVKDVDDFKSKITSMKVGEKVTLTVVRNGTTLTTAAIIGDQNQQ